MSPRERASAADSTGGRASGARMWVVVRAVRKRGQCVADVEFADRAACEARLSEWGGAHGREVLCGPLLFLLPFFVDQQAPESKALAPQFAAFARVNTHAVLGSCDMPDWLRDCLRRDPGVLVCMAKLAVAQGRLPAFIGEQLEADLADVLRATKTAH